MLEGWPPPIFDPAGPFAGSITTLAWVLLAMAAAVFAVVMAALWIALFGKDRLKARLGGDWVIWAGGIAFPVVLLSLQIGRAHVCTPVTNAPLVCRFLLAY